MGSANAFRWNGRPGHYEVYYLTITDPGTGVGIWIRYTMVAPIAPAGDDAGQSEATCSLWFLAMDPRPGGVATLARKATYGIERLEATREPFSLMIAGATLTDDGMAGSFEDVSWELRWKPAARPYEPVNRVLQRLGVAKTVLVLPHAHVPVEGVITLPGGESLELAGTCGGQAHLWGSKHASSWAWVHCNDFTTEEGQPVDAFIDGVSAIVPRLGREVGPNTPVVARIDGAEFRSTSPLRILRNHSSFGLEGWRFEATDGALRVVGEVAPVRDQLAGVTYHDPDGQLAYCYNTETASMRLDIQERSSGRGSGWSTLRTLTSSGRTHYEVGQRQPAAGLELLTK
jgi:hypothetical protein